MIAAVLAFAAGLLGLFALLSAMIFEEKNERSAGSAMLVMGLLALACAFFAGKLA